MGIKYFAINQTNAIGAIHEGKLFAVGLFDCKVNSDVFHFWVDQFLLPELPSNSVILVIKRTRPRKPSKVDDDALRADVEQYPDDYQYERAARFGCGTSTIGDALKRLNITVKKRPYGTRKQKQNSESSI